MEAVRSAVVKFGADQWYDFGLELQFNGAEISALTTDKVIPTSKLQALIERRRLQVGNQQLAPLLLRACRRVPYAIYSAVMDDINQATNYY